MAPKRGSGGTAVARAIGKGTKGSAQQQAALLHGKKQSISAPTSADRRSLTPPAYTKEQLAEAEGRLDLAPDDKRYQALWNDVQAKMGMPKHKPIHSEGMNRIDHILRVFDLDPAYGPCLGMTRMERWQRADKLGDQPPLEIKEILETRQGVLDYKYSVLHDKGV